MKSDQSESRPAGLSGSVRFIAIVMTVLIAVLGIGVVTDVISLSTFGHYAKRIALVACIVALASVCLALLGRSKP